MNFEVYPLETHAFEGDGNDFLCSMCHRPRLLHYRYPFRPKPDPAHLFQGEPVRYRGPHPRFTPPGRMTKDSLPVISKTAKEYAERVRRAERAALAKYLNESDTP